MNIQPDRKGIGSVLKEKGDWISRHPACSYEVYDTMMKLEEVWKEIDDPPLEATVFYFLTTMDEIWSKISSAASENIPQKTQLELIREIGNFWKEIGESFERDEIPSTSLVISGPYGIRKLIPEKKKKPRYKPEKKEKIKIPSSITKEKELKEKIIKLFAYYKGDKKYSVIRENSDPIFMLKSGYRSFSFFNMDKATYNHEVSPLIMKIIKSEIEKIKENAKKEGKKIDRVVYFEKSHGETGAFQPEISLIGQAVGILSATLPKPTLDPSVETVKGIEIEGGDNVIVIDDLVSTGSGLRHNIARVEEMGAKVYACVILFNRQLGEIPRSERTTVIFTKDEFMERRLMGPDIIHISIEDPLWASLVMKYDYLHDICLYAGQKDMCDTLEEEFHELITRSLGLENTGKENWILLLTNFEILCWNYIDKLLYGEYISEDRMFESIEDYLSFEVGSGFMIGILKEIINKKKLSKAEIMNFEKLRDYLIENQGKILDTINSRKKDIGIDNSAKETISKREAEEIVDKYLAEFEMHYRKIVEKHDLDQTELTEIKEALRKEKMAGLKMFYNVK